jgi:hypothetical protein
MVRSLELMIGAIFVAYVIYLFVKWSNVKFQERTRQHAARLELEKWKSFRLSDDNKDQ